MSPKVHAAKSGGVFRADGYEVLYEVLNLTAPLWNVTGYNDTSFTSTSLSIKPLSSLSVSQPSTNTFPAMTAPFGTIEGLPNVSKPFLLSISAESSEGGRGADTTSSTSSSPTPGQYLSTLVSFPLRLDSLIRKTIYVYGLQLCESNSGELES